MFSIGQKSIMDNPFLVLKWFIECRTKANISYFLKIFVFWKFLLLLLSVVRHTVAPAESNHKIWDENHHDETSKNSSHNKRNRVASWFWRRITGLSHASPLQCFPCTEKLMASSLLWNEPVWQTGVHKCSRHQLKETKDCKRRKGACPVHFYSGFQPGDVYLKLL